MDTISRRETAKIYQFPAGGRRPVREERQVNEVARVPATTFGSGWYHDQAITDARNDHWDAHDAHPYR